MSWKAMMKIRLQLKILMLAVLLAHLGTYMIIPLLPIFLKVEKGMSIAQIGIILAVSPFTFQLASLLGGWLSDRIGRRRIIAAGAWLNAMAIAGFAWFDDYGLFISMGLLSGIGVGLHAPSIKAAIAAIADEDDSDTFAFSLRGIAANAGGSRRQACSLILCLVDLPRSYFTFRQRFIFSSVLRFGCL